MRIIEPGGLISATRYGQAASTPQTAAAPAIRSPLTLVTVPHLADAGFLLHHIGKQAEKARPLDRLSEFALPLRGDRSNPAGYDLAALRDEALQQLDILVIDLGRVGAGERARFPPPKKWPARRGAACRPTADLALHLCLHPLRENTISLGLACLAQSLSLCSAPPLAVISAAAILHYHRWPLLQSIDPDRQVADHVFIDPHRPLELRNCGSGGLDIQEHVVALAVLPHAVGQVTQSPILPLPDFAAMVGDELREGIGEGIDLRARDILTRNKHVFVQRHTLQIPCR